MIADVVGVLCILMSVVLGIKQLGRVAFPSFLIVTVSYLCARVIGFFATQPLAGALKGQIGARVAVTAVSWLILYFLFDFLWRKQVSKKPEEGRRINFDADGNPIVGSMWPRRINGAFWGLLRGIVSYGGIVTIMLSLTPIHFFKNGHGTVVYHPNSTVMKVIIHYDPDQKSMEEVGRGLRSLHYYRTHRKVRRKARKDKELKALFADKTVKEMLTYKKEQKYAAKTRHGKRQASLLLWMPRFQELCVNSHKRSLLNRISKKLPAPNEKSTKLELFDKPKEDKKGKSKSKKSKKRK